LCLNIAHLETASVGLRHVMQVQGCVRTYITLSSSTQRKMRCCGEECGLKGKDVDKQDEMAVLLLLSCLRMLVPNCVIPHISDLCKNVETKPNIRSATRTVSPIPPRLTTPHPRPHVISCSSFVQNSLPSTHTTFAHPTSDLHCSSASPYALLPYHIR
jgi:hypothetical protein